jgi:hypothetical protein
VKPRHMLTWMLWSAAACLSSQGHGQVLVEQSTTTVMAADRTPLRTVEASPIDPVLAVSALTLFLGGLALVRAGWASRRDGGG